MCHELRKLMASADATWGGGQLYGHVEIDETLLGGRRPRAKKMENKTIVKELLQCGGRIVARPVPNATKATLEPVITAHVERGSTISTDEHKSYGDLHMDLVHGVVNHSAKEYVRGEHHVNTLGGHWSLLKRAIKGTHVHVSEKHAWKYVSEFSYRRNMRHSHSGMFNLLVHAFSLPRVIER